MESSPQLQEVNSQEKPRLNKSLDALSSAVGYLTDEVDVLENKLEPLLNANQVSPPPEEKTVASNENDSQIVRTVDAQSVKIDEQRFRIIAMLTRLDL
jgi:hypothetical protein